MVHRGINNLRMANLRRTDYYGRCTLDIRSRRARDRIHSERHTEVLDTCLQ